MWGSQGRKDPLLPPPSRVVSRPNSLTLPFRTPATQAIGNTNMVASRLIKREKGSLPVDVVDA